MGLRLHIDLGLYRNIGVGLLGEKELYEMANLHLSKDVSFRDIWTEASGQLSKMASLKDVWNDAMSDSEGYAQRLNADGRCDIPHVLPLLNLPLFFYSSDTDDSDNFR